VWKYTKTRNEPSSRRRYQGDRQFSELGGKKGFRKEVRGDNKIDLI
jgi:hypothetical protein